MEPARPCVAACTMHLICAVASVSCVSVQVEDTDDEEGTDDEEALEAPNKGLAPLKISTRNKSRNSSVVNASPRWGVSWMLLH